VIEQALRVAELLVQERPKTASIPADVPFLRRHAPVLVVAALLVGAFLLRLPGITTPSTEQRETEGALLAREWYLGSGSGLPAWKQRVLHDLRESVKPIEPPILDYVTSLEWRLTGENFWFPRLLSSFFWVLGGVFVYRIALRLTSRGGSLIALALYLVWPYAVWLSRHFMPDALMVCSLLAGSLAVIRYWERPSRRRFLGAAAVACLATAIKPGIAFLFLLALFVALAVYHRRLWAATRSGRLPLFALIASAAAIGYYVYGTYFSDFIWSGADTKRITPELLVHASFWREWWNMVSFLLRFPQPQQWLALVPLAVGALGVVLAKGTARAILVGLALGYVAFAFTFANYTDTHPYYSLPLIPMLALSIGVVAGVVLRSVGEFGRAAVFALVVVVVVIAGYKSHAALTERETRQTIEDYRRLGEITGHTTRAIVVSGDLRTPALYWGWMVGDAWDLSYNHPPPDPADHDFLVVEGLDEFERTPAAQRFVRNLPVVARTSRYAVFDLRGLRG
jgi:4-amino-4-deoxy-L-arabinose transferase-like glycosyltransferase